MTQKALNDSPSEKSLNTLVADVYELFDPKRTHIPSEENLEYAANAFKEILRTRLAGREDIRNPLRFSSLGKPDRQLWYMAQQTPSEEMTSKTYMKFLYGDIIELMLLFLVKESGHTVEMEQAEVECEGVLGHIDAKIDGVIVDVKSASPFGYKKFREGSVVDDDPFGYIKQISGYSEILTPGVGPAFLAFDKVSGDICVSPVSVSISQRNHPEPRIRHLKDVIESATPPERCYPDVEDGKSGNRKLDTGCSYCAFKHTCWDGLRNFAYSGGPRYLTKVVKTPDVPEFFV